jgi:hypothetical protein
MEGGERGGTAAARDAAATIFAEGDARAADRRDPAARSMRRVARDALRELDPERSRRRLGL